MNNSSSFSQSIETYNSQYSDKYDKELFCILDVDLTNEFRDNHEQIDIFHHIYKGLFHGRIGIIPSCIVVTLFYSNDQHEHVELRSFENDFVKLGHQQLSNRLYLMSYSSKKNNPNLQQITRNLSKTYR